MNVKIPCILRASQMAKAPVWCWESRVECNQTHSQSIGWWANHFLDGIDANNDSLRLRHLCAHSDQQIQKYKWNLRTVVWFRSECWLNSSVMSDGWMERTFIAESHWGRTERIANVWWVEKGWVAMCISLLKKQKGKKWRKLDGKSGFGVCGCWNDLETWTIQSRTLKQRNFGGNNYSRVLSFDCWEKENKSNKGRYVE